MENFKIDIDADGIAVIAFDVPGRSMNTLTSSVMKEIPELVERIKTPDRVLHEHLVLVEREQHAERMRRQFFDQD